MLFVCYDVFIGSDKHNGENIMIAIAINKSTGKEFNITDVVEDTLGCVITEENSSEAEMIAWEWAIENFGKDNCNAGIKE